MLKDNFRLGSFHLLFDHGSWRWRFGRSPSPTNSVFVRVVLMRSALFASHTGQSCGDWVTIRHHWPVNPACGVPTWMDSSATEKSTRPTQAWAGWPRSIRRKVFNPWSSISMDHAKIPGCQTIQQFAEASHGLHRSDLPWAFGHSRLCRGPHYQGIWFHLWAQFVRAGLFDPGRARSHRSYIMSTFNRTIVRRNVRTMAWCVWWSLLCSLRSIRSNRLMFCQSGHSHEDLDQFLVFSERSDSHKTSSTTRRSSWRPFILTWEMGLSGPTSLWEMLWRLTSCVTGRLYCFRWFFLVDFHGKMRHAYSTVCLGRWIRLVVHFLSSYPGRHGWLSAAKRVSWKEWGTRCSPRRFLIDAVFSLCFLFLSSFGNFLNIDRLNSVKLRSGSYYVV